MDINDFLQGPKVPKYFVDNGCSKSPDFWFRWACRIHDYEYYECEVLWDFIERAEDLGYDVVITNQEAFGTLKAAKEAWWQRRKDADIHLKNNIEILADYTVKDGRLVRKKYFHRMLLGGPVARLYYYGVRVMGRRFAK